MKTRLVGSPFFKGTGLKVTIALVLVFLGSVTLDQVSKVQMHSELLEWENERDTDQYLGKREELFVLGSRDATYVAFGWQYSRNKGAAFSMFSTLDDFYRVPMFHAITMLAIVLIYFYLRSTPVHHVLTRYGLVMVLSGALGNFIDRIIRGYVVDFIDVEWRVFGWRHDFAIFNVADVAINIGVICLLLDIFIQRERSPKQLAKTQTSSSGTSGQTA